MHPMGVCDKASTQVKSLATVNMHVHRRPSKSEQAVGVAAQGQVLHWVEQECSPEVGRTS